MIGWLVGTVQGGAQALSRSIYASMTPRAKSGEFFGLYGLSEKFAGILGFLLYGIVGTITHDPRASILSISVFFVLGIYMLWRVDEQKGEQSAAAEEALIEQMEGSRLALPEDWQSWIGNQENRRRHFPVCTSPLQLLSFKTETALK